jgi:hypothetical protein
MPPNAQPCFCCIGGIEGVGISKNTMLFSIIIAAITVFDVLGKNKELK